MIRLNLLAVLFAVSTSLVGCGATPPADDVGDSDTDSVDTDPVDTDPTDTDSVDVSIAIAGAWFDASGVEHVITAEAWVRGDATFEIATFDDASRFAVARNGDANADDPGLWSRFDWGWSDDELVYCQTARDAASEVDARATPAADLDDLDTGCGGLPWSALRARFTLAGTWDDAGGGQHRIDPFSWTSGDDRFAVSQVDDAGRWLVARNDDANAEAPGLWSRFDWGGDGDGTVRLCRTVRDAATEGDAASTPAADASDPEGGCVGSSWRELRAALSIGGDWTDNWDGEHHIDAFTWSSGASTYVITAADDGAGWLVAQNGDDNPFNPGLWSRFDWTWGIDGALWICQTAYDAATEADARATPAADPTDPADGGCSGFPWNAMTPAGP